MNDARIQALRETTLRANLALVENGLVLFTWGNVSGIDRDEGVVAIKPSGVPYEGMTVEDIVVVDLDGSVILGDKRPSTDLPSHLALYKALPTVGGVCHTHSTYATAFAQAGRSIEPLGTTHADYFYGTIPCSRALTKEEVARDYEYNTGLVIAQTIGERDPLVHAAVLVRSHGPFCVGASADDAVFHAAVLEETARMAHLTHMLAGGRSNPAPEYLIEKHFERKHGADAYYGQE